LTLRPLHIRLRSGHTLLFLHIPKAGGTTLYSVLEKQFPQEACYSVPDRLHPVDLPPNLDQYRLVRVHQGYDVYRCFQRKPVYVTMLREPIARAVSYYYHIRRHSDHPLHEVVLKREYSLLDCLNDTKMQHRFGNAQTRLLAFRILPGDDLPSGDVQLEMAKVRLHEFAYFGLVESFARSVQLLTYTFGWSPITHIQRLNAAPESDYDESISPEVRGAIAACNDLDIALYDYAVQLFQERYQQMLWELLSHRSDSSHIPLSREVISYQLSQRQYQALLNRTAAGRLVQLIRGLRRRAIPENSIWERRYYALLDHLLGLRRKHR
jgi:hypothetical protein